MKYGIHQKCQERDESQDLEKGEEDRHLNFCFYQNSQSPNEKFQTSVQNATEFIHTTLFQNGPFYLLSTTMLEQIF